MKEFKQEIQGVFDQPSDLFAIGMKYHRLCEEFDQKICSRRTPSGVAIIDPWNRKASFEYSVVVREMLEKEIVASGLQTPLGARVDLKNAIRDSCHTFEKTWKKSQ